MPKAYDPMYDSAILLGVGAAHAVAGPVDEPPKPQGVIWVPDPEQRRGWRERYVYPDAKPDAERRPFGFGKP